MFSEVSPDVLSVVKKVCTPCPNCETSLKHLPLKVSKLEERFVEFVAKTEASFSNLSHVPSDEIRNVSAEVAVVGKAVKEAISAQNNKQSVNVSGVVESGSTDTDLAVVKELFGFLGDDRVIPIEAFRLGKEPINGKPRPLKVRLSMLLRGLQYFERQSFLRALKNLRRYLCAPQLYRCTAIQCFVLESLKSHFPNTHLVIVFCQG